MSRAEVAVYIDALNAEASEGGNGSAWTIARLSEALVVRAGTAGRAWLAEGSGRSAGRKSAGRDTRPARAILEIRLTASRACPAQLSRPGSRRKSARYR
jgi:hypothetical protein